jgi:hypothetical protein
MRFKGTFILLIIGAALGAYVYFYEIKGGEQRDKAKQEENRIWKADGASIQQIDLITPEQHITAARSGEKEWKITAPRSLDGDAEELNRMATTASDISKESTLEANAPDLAPFGLNPAQVTVQIKTKDGKEFKIRFGNNNPMGSSTYGALEGKKEVFLVSNTVASAFKKKLEDLRNRSVLAFEQFDAQGIDLASEKGSLNLAKENDHWWIQGKERWAADSSAASGLLTAVSSAKVKEFFDENPEDYTTLGFEKPTVDLKLTVGKDRAIRHLTIGLEKSKLVKKGEKKAKNEPKEAKKDELIPKATETYIARDESRKELFFVDKDFLDKVLKSPADLRDKALASFTRWDIDSITLTNSNGTFNFTKAEGSGDWVLGDAKKKTKWEGVNGILDALEKQVKEFVDQPGAPAAYGLDKPAVTVVLKQKGAAKVECSLGKAAKDGYYAQIKGEPTIKVADKESFEKLSKAESDYVELPAPAAATPKK